MPAGYNNMDEMAAKHLHRFISARRWLVWVVEVVPPRCHRMGAPPKPCISTKEKGIRRKVNYLRFVSNFTGQPRPGIPDTHKTVCGSAAVA